MIYTLPDFVAAYWYYLLGAAVACTALSYFSERFYRGLKKSLIVFAFLFALAAGYELVTGNSILNLPGKVDRKLSEKPTDAETGHRYYKDYEERYGEKPPQ